GWLKRLEERSKGLGAALCGADEMVVVLGFPFGDRVGNCLGIALLPFADGAAARPAAGTPTRRDFDPIGHDHRLPPDAGAGIACVPTSGNRRSGRENPRLRRGSSSTPWPALLPTRRSDQSSQSSEEWPRGLWHRS